MLKKQKRERSPLDQVGIHVIDDRTLKVELIRPTPSFLQSTAHTLSPVHRLIDQQHPQWPYECEKNYPCNGPFQLKINEPNQGCQLIKNPLYWDANHIQLDQITLSHIEPAQAIQAFQKNEIDWVGNPFGSWHPYYTPREKKTISSPSLTAGFAGAFSTLIAHHSTIASYAKPLPMLSNVLKLNSAACLHRPKPAFSPLLPQTRENNPGFFPDFDKEKAQRLLHEALNELNLTKEDLSPLSLIFHEKGVRETSNMPPGAV